MKCTKCQSDCFKFPNEWLCHKCDWKDVEALCKMYVDNLFKEEVRENEGNDNKS